MLKSLAAITAAFLLTCPRGRAGERRPRADAGAAEKAADAGSDTSRVETCLDQWLAAHHLNSYGDPPETAYAGGSPLFDERTGQTRDRVQYVFARRPEAKKACGETR